MVPRASPRILGSIISGLPGLSAVRRCTESVNSRAVTDAYERNFRFNFHRLTHFRVSRDHARETYSHRIWLRPNSPAFQGNSS